MKKDLDKTKKDHTGDENKSRRNFLKLGWTVGAGAVTAGGLLHATSGKAQAGSGEKTKVLSVDGKLIEVDVEKVESMCAPATGKEARKGIPGRRFVMVIDLAKCKNARKCVEVCQEEHNLTADKEWIKVFKMQDSEDTAPYWFPKPCFHCQTAPCVNVCPVEATYKRSDGITLIDSTKCIGCKYCMVACPYSARVFNWDALPKEMAEAHKGEKYSPETSLPVITGTVGKCDFCPDMIKRGKLPHCVTGCPMGVIYFGDENEDAVTNGTETLRLSKLLKEKAGYRYLEYFGTKPNTYYLPPVDRQFPFESGLPEDEQSES